MRVTNPNITELEANGIFVPGTNEAGIHGAGAALLGYEKFGMKWGKGIGHLGQCYGIPTKDRRIKTLPVESIKKYVDKFIEYAKTRPDLTFHVTEIGCGLAGYQPKDIAPLFKDAMHVENINLPLRFWNELLPVKAITENTDPLKPIDASDNEFSLFSHWKDDDDRNSFDNGSIKHFQD